MKRKFVAALVLAIVLGTFMSCENVPTLPEILTTVKGYNDEFIVLVLSLTEDVAPTEFTEGESLTFDEGMTALVDYAGSDELNLIMTLDRWVASDGTEINGTVVLDIEYYTSPVSISTIRIAPSMINFDRTSVSYVTELIDDDSTNVSFTPEYNFFFCASLIVDGEILILNMFGW